MSPPVSEAYMLRESGLRVRQEQGCAILRQRQQAAMPLAID